MKHLTALATSETRVKASTGESQPCSTKAPRRYQMHADPEGTTLNGDETSMPLTGRRMNALLAFQACVDRRSGQLPIVPKPSARKPWKRVSDLAACLRRRPEQSRIRSCKGPRQAQAEVTMSSGERVRCVASVPHRISFKQREQEPASSASLTAGGPMPFVLTLIEALY